VEILIKIGESKLKKLPNGIEKLNLGVLIDYRDFEGLTKKVAVRHNVY
jgi:hypothetical protein